jgi:GNAT superfamily N-acetyltransferase
LESVALHALFFSEGEAVGMVSATEPRAGDVWLVSMWVDPVARGQGVGDLLIQFVVEWAQAWGACRVRLGVWDGNTAAIGLYERNGFVDGGASQQDGDVVERRMDLTLL